MDTQHLNAIQDFMEEMGEIEFTVNHIFDLHATINQADGRIALLQFELDLKNKLIEDLHQQVLQLMS